MFYSFVFKIFLCQLLRLSLDSRHIYRSYGCIRAAFNGGCRDEMSMAVESLHQLIDLVRQLLNVYQSAELAAIDLDALDRVD